MPVAPCGSGAVVLLPVVASGVARSAAWGRGASSATATPSMRGIAACVAESLAAVAASKSVRWLKKRKPRRPVRPIGASLGLRRFHFIEPIASPKALGVIWSGHESSYVGQEKAPRGRSCWGWGGGGQAGGSEVVAPLKHQYGFASLLGQADSMYHDEGRELCSLA